MELSNQSRLVHSARTAAGGITGTTAVAGARTPVEGAVAAAAAMQDGGTEASSAGDDGNNTGSIDD